MPLVMRGTLFRPLDAHEVEFRMRTLRTGVWPSLFACAYTGAYYVLTWERPHRPLLLALVLAAVAGTVLVARLRPDRLVGGRFTELFFIAWSLGLIAIIASAATLDGGTASPVTLLLFTPLVYAALSYPLGSMLVVAACDVLAYCGVAVADGTLTGERGLLFLGVLVTAAWICAWQTRNHDEQRHELARMSRTDPLTGVLNRRGFEERFAAELARARRDSGGLVLVVADLDHFKTVNDSGGHAAGDRVLRAVAAALTDELRGSDAVGRLGGDEFGALLPGADVAGALARARDALTPITRASFGAAAFPEDGTDADTLHRTADLALYAAKRSRPEIRLYSADTA